MLVLISAASLPLAVAQGAPIQSADVHQAAPPRGAVSTPQEPEESRRIGPSRFGHLDSVQAARLQVMHRHRPPVVIAGLAFLGGIVLLIMLYTIRHYVFTINRVFGKQRHPYTDV